ncbi:hypothetical protein L1987_52880 [Smallanthus sonchifolius]|uniref:Uncharacterized protein n=1 Tax=Smallanthus sonchifolius TaxID=185202 RepID=A0ACB9EUG8_9ASTR|nr:hypothetical protein L1987_52880 [Smallanthus sonchifolius]
MVFNYRTLNDNTYKDQYSLPGINTPIQRIGTAKLYSKFDLKSGFHQVAMAEDSIEWTTFLVPKGLYEWLVMPFGLKNAPAIFQRKMDECFKGIEEFIAVYIDDILGLVLSPTKMKIACSEVDFLGAIIGKDKIKLLPHIIKKICDFKEEKLKTKNGLRSFLGILNYARSYIPKLSSLLGPLYEKTKPHDDKRMKPSDYEIIREIKRQVETLPDLEILPEDAYIVIEVDGCMEGWGGVCKWKRRKMDPKKNERISAYASEKFKTIQSTIDAEINACINSLEKLKIYYLDKREITLRTDCQAIISFYNKTNSNKASRVRWLKFADIITGTGVQINIEHIEGKQNTLADALTRLVNLCFAECTDQAQEVLMKSLNMIEEVLEEGVRSKKERNGLDQIIQISNHFQEYMKDHSHSRNQEHCTEDTKSKPIHSQSQMKQEVPTLKSHNNWNPKQQENQLQPCEISKQFWTSKPKSVFQNQPVITSGETTGQRSESKIKTPESLRPYATNWAGSQSKTRKMFSAQSKFLECDALNDEIARRQQLHKRSLKWNQALYLIDENWTPPVTQDRYAKL